ncbi:hypothetical protein RJT34_22656 [Clitoria ternatea]|uniref:FAF domain-containing protein n=1 Tax=Clitoria ternatea TaxID=43366 RepID=A0AAN9FLV6_CLITE
MSYSSVCQGLQSCVEPCLLETRVLKLKLAPPASNSNHSQSPSSNTTPSSDSHSNKNSELSGGCNWSFLQSLSNISHSNKAESDSVYVHPAVKCSTSMLSARSLELCTESLGSETGSIASDSTHDMSLFSFESSPTLITTTTNNTNNHNNNKSNNNVAVSKRLKRDSTSFPPPLSSMGQVQVRSHREDGRLILEAVTCSSPQPYFQVERGNGRLRLRLFKSVPSYGSDDEGEAEWLNQEEEEEEECVGHAEDEMDMAKFVRPSRCKESGNRVIFGDSYFEQPSLSLCL